MVLGSGAAQAVGLGPIEVISGLNERLDARIPVHELKGQPLDAVSVGLAPMRHFRELGIQYRSELSRLEFELEADAAGGHVIRVRSPRPMVEPFVTFVVELDLPTGRMIREYTVLLDPPPVVTRSASTGSVADSARATTVTAPVADTGASTSGTAAGPAPAPTGGSDRYGPVPRGSSAWRVAEAVQRPGTTIYQMMIALFHANPDAFENDDLERLRAGVMLDVPSAAEVAAISHARAVAEYRQHVMPAPSSGDTASGTTEVASREPAPATKAGEDAAARAALDTQAGATGEPDTASGRFEPMAAHASEGEGLQFVGTDVQTEVMQAGLEELRADVDEMQATLGRMRRQEAPGEVVSDLEQRFESRLAVRDDQLVELRAELARVRAEVASARARREPSAAATLGGTHWLLGLTALLGFICGAIGGIWSARRVVVSRLEQQMADAAALGYMGGTGADPVMGDDSEDSAWADDDSEFPVVRRHAAEMNENKPVSPNEEVAESGGEPGTAEQVETEDENNRGPSLDDLRATSEAWAHRYRDQADADRADADATAASEAATGEPGAEPAGEGEAPTGPASTQGTDDEAGSLLDDELDDSSDFYHSLAKLYIESGWPHDAEELMREVIEQNPDKAVYRALLLEALYHMGNHEQFLEEFEVFRGVADRDDPSWTWVLAMGKILLPDNPAFAEGDDDVVAAVTLEHAADSEPDDVDTPQEEDEELVFEVGERELRDSEDVDLDHPEYLWSDLELDQPEPEQGSEPDAEPGSEPAPESGSDPEFGSAWQSEWEAQPESDDFPELTPEDPETPDAAEDDSAAESTDEDDPDEPDKDQTDEQRRLAGGGSSGSS